MIVAIEGGATHTRAGLYTPDGILIAETEGGPGNPVASGVDNVSGILCALARQFLSGKNEAFELWAGLAGAGEISVQKRMAEMVGGMSGASRVCITTDLHPILFANAGTGSGVLVVSGTGSAVLAKCPNGRVLRVGGRGSLFGDDGSSYRVAVEALRACAAMVDGMGPETNLLGALLIAVGLRSFEDFASWSGTASKSDVAALAKIVSEVAEGGDVMARACLEEQARRLAAQAVIAIERLKLGQGTRIFMNGSLLDGSEWFRDAFKSAVDAYADAQFMECSLKGHLAIFQAMKNNSDPSWSTAWVPDRTIVSLPNLPLTESISGEEIPLDRLDALGIVRRMNTLDSELPAIVASQEAKIAQAIETAAISISKGGRVIYVGAGTSGRLGVLDASECPPTFGVSPDKFVGMVAGGDRALRESVEGEEDDEAAAVRDITPLNLGPTDIVIGIAASGSTPYVIAAIKEGKRRQAKTILICCSPHFTAKADIVIVLATGPEAVAGSTRLKAGTATKMVLNMISTGAMALAGYVYQGLMVEMKPSNSKLKNRAARIVSALSGVSVVKARELLILAEWSIPTAIVMALRNIDVNTAKGLLCENGGRLGNTLAQTSGRC